MSNEQILHNTCAYETPVRMTRYQRWRRRLFPIKHCFCPEAPADWKDCVTIHSQTKLSWADRLRVLLTGVVITHSRTVTENEVGQSVTAMEVYIGTARDMKPDPV